MTTLPPLDSLRLPAIVPAPATTATAGNATPAAKDQAPATPSTTVTLGQTRYGQDPLIYTNKPESVPPVLERKSNDALTFSIIGNASSSLLGVRFNGLGAALMQQLSSTGSNFAQSALQFDADTTPAAEIENTLQKQLHAAADNRISLSIKTANGTTVELTLSSQANGLGVEAKVTNGKLTEREMEALGKLSGGFQKAIDGLAALPPTLDLSSLMQFDSNIFSSLDLNANIKTEAGDDQSLSFHVDDAKRTISTSGAAGAIDLKVDTKNLQILGSAGQQAEAMRGYLQQFDEAKARGNADASLIGMFKDAFTSLNKNYDAVIPKDTPEQSKPVTLGAADRSVLSGLADFTASVRQSAQVVNPMRPGETDTFSYDVSQRSSITGSNQKNHTIEQQRKSALSASFHNSLFSGAPLQLTEAASSQNYFYTQIDDSQSSTATIKYKDGLRVNASLTESLSQSKRVMKYVMGKLEKDYTEPSSTSTTKDLQAQLKLIN